MRRIRGVCLETVSNLSKTSRSLNHVWRILYFVLINSSYLFFSWTWLRCQRLKISDRIVFIKLAVLFTIVNDVPSLSIVNDDPLLTIINKDPLLMIVNDEPKREGERNPP